ncbi:Uncharacterized protein FKW44_018186, partial [Caligus rogercresseyi]
MNEIENMSNSRVQCVLQEQRKNNQKMTTIITQLGVESNEPSIICDEILHFYKNIYKCFDCKESTLCKRCKAANADFCNELRCNKDDVLTVPEEDNNQIETHLTLKEIIIAVQTNAKNRKAPGPSGFTFEFFKKYLFNLAPILLKFYEKVMEVGYFPNFASDGTMVLIPKKNKDQ